MRLFLALVVGTLLAGAPGAARAEETQVAIVPFTGLHGDEPQTVIERALKKKLGADKVRTVRAGDADKLDPRFIVTGVVAVKPSRVVTISILDGNGDLVGQLSQPITKGRHLDADQLRKLAVDTLQLVSGAAPTSPEEVEVDTSVAEVEGPVEQADDAEPLHLTAEDPAVELRKRLKARQAARAPRPPRPWWAPWFEISAGALISSRAVSYSPAYPTNYRTGTAGGLLVDGTVYPLAFLHDKKRGVFAGLGVGLYLNVPFWPTTIRDGTSEEYETSELQVEGAVRWNFIVRKARPRIDIMFIGGGGMHRFTIAKAQDAAGNPVDVGPPDAGYVYATFGGQLRVFVLEWISLYARFQAHYVPDAGPTEDLVRNGLADTYGLRAQLGLDLRVWRGLRVGAQGIWERFALSFLGTPGRLGVANSAEDQYFGGVAYLGYVL